MRRLVWKAGVATLVGLGLLLLAAGLEGCTKRSRPNDPPGEELRSEEDPGPPPPPDETLEVLTPHGVVAPGEDGQDPAGESHEWPPSGAEEEYVRDWEDRSE